jgi:hypothetical protein
MRRSRLTRERGAACGVPCGVRCGSRRYRWIAHAVLGISSVYSARFSSDISAFGGLSSSVGVLSSSESKARIDGSTGRARRSARVRCDRRRARSPAVPTHPRVPPCRAGSRRTRHRPNIDWATPSSARRLRKIGCSLACSKSPMISFIRRRMSPVIAVLPAPIQTRSRRPAVVPGRRRRRCHPAPHSCAWSRFYRDAYSCRCAFRESPAGVSLDEILEISRLIVY